MLLRELQEYGARKRILQNRRLMLGFIRTAKKFGNKSCPKSVVMLNLFQHLFRKGAEIPNQVRNDI
ncbi:MAG: hypothetical protein J6V73_05090, partial [Spirochaetaceae bacterium]|nr:hypothetical protein [Spirochaetaceae bacterium]